jgi:uncharacterized membrane protein YeaQ/YmgE (transglycosylase-associated protein family)
MDILVWMLTGGAVGWAGYSFLGFNEARGMTASIIIGTLGGFFGGKMIAPMFSGAAAVSGDFSSLALLFAAAAAAAFLAVGNLVYNRWGV